MAFRKPSPLDIDVESIDIDDSEHKYHKKPTSAGKSPSSSPLSYLPPLRFCRCNRSLHSTTRILIFLIFVFLVLNPFIFSNTRSYFKGSGQVDQILPSESSPASAIIEQQKSQNYSHLTSARRAKKNASMFAMEQLGPARPYKPVVLNTSLAEMELKKTFFFLYSHPLPTNFKIHETVVHDEGCGAIGLKETDLCFGHGEKLDLTSFTLPKQYLGNRCGSVELTDSTFCVNRDTVVNMESLNQKQRTAFYDRLLDLVPEPEPDRRVFAPPSSNVTLEIVLQEMIPIKSPRLVKTIFNIANMYGGTGASLTLLICPVHYKYIEFLEEEEGKGWKGVNIIQLGREYGPEEFQEMLTSQWLSEYYEGKQVLLLHPDTMLLRPIEDTMVSNEFDILGKPYTFEVEVVYQPPTPSPPLKKKKKKLKVPGTNRTLSHVHERGGNEELRQRLHDDITARLGDILINQPDQETAPSSDEPAKDEPEPKSSSTSDTDLSDLEAFSTTIPNEAHESDVEPTPVSDASASASLHKRGMPDLEKIEKVDDHDDGFEVPTVVVNNVVQTPAPLASAESSRPPSSPTDEEKKNVAVRPPVPRTPNSPHDHHDHPAELKESKQVVEEEGEWEWVDEDEVDQTLNGNQTLSDGNSTIVIETPPEPVIPAPIIKIESMRVGNTATGYSLRRVEKIRQVVAGTPDGQKSIPEDEYWTSQMTPAPPAIAIRFAISSDTEVDMFANGTYKHVPTGVYAPWKFPRLFGKLGGRLMRSFVHDNIYQMGDDPKLRFSPDPSMRKKSDRTGLPKETTEHQK